MNDPYALPNLFQQPAESWQAYLNRMGDLYRAAPALHAHPRAPLDRSALLAHLSADTWTTVNDLAARVGCPIETVRQVLKRARSLDAPIEVEYGLGWRLIKMERVA